MFVSARDAQDRSLNFTYAEFDVYCDHGELDLTSQPPDAGRETR